MGEELTGRVALVTGGGSGLGRATCLRFARGGAHVLVADIDEGSAGRTAELAADAGGSAEPVALDVADSAAVDEAFRAAFETHGERFDCLVNNAGTDRGADLVDIDDERWHQVFGVNVHGPMHTGRAFVRGRLALGRADLLADVVNVVSISALTVGAGAGAYNASKAALGKLTEVMQTEAREHGWPVRVSAIHPAAMNTPMMEQWSLPQERMMDPDIVARLIEVAVTMPPETVLQNVIPTLRNEYFPR
ncbi:SDR family oxidoreductase [Nocardioides sp. TF02-7]|uniref:SDR family oxidoreductase n=1 Tax=Nocardioides sp. TF02-7 TaxID=2917724 RepID=UPI001F068517|nr:SDR family oxidoreductase [Nocardioides sp. TF02-7]UMG93659.1 SDR family oxidoreductase [Nocardioides sp. TF02-7]